MIETREIITLQNGDLYLGSINEVSKHPEGFGVLASKVGKSIHQGFFKKGIPNGYGIYFSGPGNLQGATLKGMFVNGKLEGEGSLSQHKEGYG